MDSGPPLGNRSSQVVRIVAACGLAILATCVTADTLEGKVVEDHSGTPLASANVRVFKTGTLRAAAALDTDSDGRFQSPGLPAGEYRIEVAKPNYTSATLRFHLEGSSSPLIVRLIR